MNAANPARTHGIGGNVLKVVVPAAGYCTLTSNITIDGTALAVGDVIDFGVELEVSNIETGAVTRYAYAYAYLQQYDGAAFGDRAYDVYRDGGASYGSELPIPNGQVGFRTQRLTVKAGKTLIQCVKLVPDGETYRFKDAWAGNITKTAALI
ncbi:hypothetical protein ASH00_11750 [Arthrobacter sp. Soil782]|uniref:hypothetical protein n=1 Tax=Arthrobacter sp. Soil782 TaxID=1736410 RepID=UPI0006FE820D|nr:hypothetical protein [Arthrobacter sp. Soil782]KRF05102.1 hypothetical protein ASH00_11750 [Arthrobacter sp. Soil782]